jgi:chromosome partitioning protein
VIIDGAAQLQDRLLGAIRSADLILVPTTPGDAEHIKDLVDIIKYYQGCKDTTKACLLRNRVKKGTILSSECDKLLMTYELPILNSIISDWVVYPMTVRKGQSIFCEKNNASIEMQSLIQEIRGVLNV